MLKKILLFFTGLVSIQIIAAQSIPNIKTTTLQGKTFETGILNQPNNKIHVLCFWATWCMPCINELSTINDLAEEWAKELQFDLYAISEDDSRTTKKVPAIASGKGWTFSILIDKNQEFKRFLNFSAIPFTLVVKNGKVIYRHNGYTEGDETQLYEILKNNQ